MNLSQASPGQLGKALIELFPPALREAILEDRAFKERLGLIVNVTVQFDQNSPGFDRSVLFNALRTLYRGLTSSVEVLDTSNQSWKLSLTGQQPLLQREGLSHYLPNLVCLSSVKGDRLAYIDAVMKENCIADASVITWRSILEQRGLEDDEVDLLFSEFRLTPAYMENALPHRLLGRTIKVGDLVPSERKYFDRLVGEPHPNGGLQEYYSTVVKERIESAICRDESSALREVFVFSAHPWGAQAVSLSGIPKQVVLETYKWLEESGDRFSQVGAIESGLSNLDVMPELEGPIGRMVRQILSDDPEQKEGRLHLLSGLIVLTEGELVRTGIVRDSPPYWRRLASIAHAGLLERGVLKTKTEWANFADWAMGRHRSIFLLQALVDLRQEPRWMPEFILPAQLKAEFVGRIAFSAQFHKDKIVASGLRKLLVEEGEGSIRAAFSYPSSFLPGPLEGGLQSSSEMPREIEMKVNEQLAASRITSQSFVTALNAALIYRINSIVVTKMIESLRRARHGLIHSTPREDAFSFLSGLARIAAATRSVEVAEEVRILLRGIRRREDMDINQESAMCIALIAAASHADLESWRVYVGECFTEFCFEDMPTEQVIELRSNVRKLLQIDPGLWRTMARGEAAISALH